MGNAAGFLTLLATTTTPSLLLHRRYTSLLRLTNHRLTRPLSSIYRRRFHHHHSNRGSNFNLPLSSSPPLKLNASHSSLHTQAASVHFTDSSSSSSFYPAAHPWPEWSSFIKNLYNSGYCNCATQGFGIGADEFVSVTSFPEEFIRAATACLAFAYEKPDFLGMLSKRDIEVLVENGTPFLFKNGEESLRKMRVLLGGNGCGDSNGVTADKAQTVDLIRFLVSYASAVVSSENNIRSDIELAESSVRNLLSELAWLSYVAPDANLSGSVQNQLPGAYGQPPRTFEQSIQMKNGDWVCPRCSFMNFARSMKCFECDEARPKRKLTGGEWECPQCNFFNYVRNMVCLRCDCKRPVGLPHERTGSGLGIKPGNMSSACDDAELKSRLAENEEKAQRGFSKISQMDGTSDMGTAIVDEDFPEIMPLRKGVNRFVLSTRKIPLERRLANAQHQGNLGPGGSLDNKRMQSTDNTEKQKVSWSVDDIIGHKSSVFELGNKTLGSGQDDGTNNSLLITNSAFTHSSTAKGSNSDFVPFPAKEPENSKMDESSKVGIENQFLSSSSGRDTGAVFHGNDGQSRDSWQPSEKPPSHDKDMEQAEKSERRFRRVAELHNVTDVASSILDDDFLEIMSTRKGQNRFVVSKKKDRSLTSPAYKRREAMEQSNNANFVPFVPFPPNYFARKDNQQTDGEDLANKTAGITPNSPTLEFSEKINDARPRLQVASDMKRAVNREYPTGSRNSGHGIPMSANSTQKVIDHGPQSWNGCNHGYTMNENMSSRENMMSNSQQNFGDNQTGVGDSMKSGESWREKTSETLNSTGTTAQTSENLNIGDSWSGGSLEGSAVRKEPDPLDMSEEAKAERWFRRVAQIKNISELSQIPDEDFPSIMPMWKGVNRFVVSKRKTPLKRRLTSPRYRRNLLL